MLTYANDLRCHNAEPGTFGHECGRDAVWLGQKPSGFRSGFCDDCRHNGTEARDCAGWERITVPTEDQAERMAERIMDRLDHQLMSGILSNYTYANQVRRLDEWTKRAARLRRAIVTA